MTQNIDYAWTWNLKKLVIPLLFIKPPRCYKWRLEPGVLIQCIENLFKFYYVFPILCNMNTGTNTLTTQLITYSSICKNKSHETKMNITDSSVRYPTKFPWIYLVFLRNSVLNKIIGILRVPSSFPSIMTNLVPPIECIQSKSHNGSASVKLQLSYHIGNLPSPTPFCLPLNINMLMLTHM